MSILKRRFTVTEEFSSNQTKVISKRSREQIVLPQHLVRQCLRFHHEGMAHPGRAKTIAVVQTCYYWPTIRRDCANHLSQCKYCCRRKQFNNRAKVPIQTYSRPMRPFYRMHMDVTGPFNTTEDGNKYILVFKCALTKWVEIFAIPQQNAEQVAKCLIDEVIMRHGCPHEIVTDRGTEFHNKTIKQIVKMSDIPRHIKTTAYNPRSDGMVETHMRPLKDQLAAYVNKFQTNWDQYLGIISGAYRMTVNEATGYSPFYLVHGREASMPSGEFIESKLSEQLLHEDLQDYVRGFMEVMSHTWEHVSHKFIKNVDEYNKRPKEPLIFVPYEVGDYFMKKKQPKRSYVDLKTRERGKITAKLQYRWTGPYRITEKLSPVLYKAMVHGSEVRVHAINMKPKTENWSQKQLRTESITDREYSFVVWDDDQGVFKLKKCTHKTLWPGYSGTSTANGEDLGLEEQKGYQPDED